MLDYFLELCKEAEYSYKMVNDSVIVTINKIMLLDIYFYSSYFLNLE